MVGLEENVVIWNLGGGGMAVVVTKMNVLPFLSRAEQRPFKIPVHDPGLIVFRSCTGYD